MLSRPRSYSAFPHEGQNLEEAGPSAPQAAHFLVATIAVPQFGQNLVPSGTSCAHFGHGTVAGPSFAPS